VSDEKDDPGADPTRRLISSGCGSEVVYLGFVMELATRTDLWQRMQREHTPTPEGFCAARTCGRGGYGTPCLRWPCPTRALADWAGDAYDRLALRGIPNGRVSLRRAAPRRPG